MKKVYKIKTVNRESVIKYGEPFTEFLFLEEELLRRNCIKVGKLYKNMSCNLLPLNNNTLSRAEYESYHFREVTLQPCKITDKQYYDSILKYYKTIVEQIIKDRDSYRENYNKSRDVLRAYQNKSEDLIGYYKGLLRNKTTSSKDNELKSLFDALMKELQ